MDSARAQIIPVPHEFFVARHPALGGSGKGRQTRYLLFWAPRRELADSRVAGILPTSCQRRPALESQARCPRQKRPSAKPSALPMPPGNTKFSVEILSRQRVKVPGLNASRAKACLMTLLFFTLFCGCASPRETGLAANSYYLDPYRDLRKLGRVALVELDNTSRYPEISADMTDALFLAVQKRQVFGLTVVNQNDQDWRSLQENLDSLQALRQLVTMRDTLKCNGLLVGTVTEYQPYPHMLIGLRLKLLDLTDGRLLWGLEQVWDCADRSVQQRIKTYFREQLKSGLAPLGEELVAISSLNFARYVAYEVAQTLERQKGR